MAADISAAGLVSQLDEEWTALADLGAGLTDEEWSRPTPCPGWSVAAQYAHVIGTESSLLGRPSPQINAGRPDHIRNDIGGFNEVWVAAFADRPRPEVLEQFAEVTGARRKELASLTEADFDAPAQTPIGQADYRRYMEIRVFDCWVHEQDVRDGVGRPGHESGPVAEQAVEEIVRALGFLVGKKAAAPAGSSVRIELSGPVNRRIEVAVPEGRARVVEGLAGEPTVTVEMTSTAFTRLACGRIAPERVLDRGELGGVRISGDTDLGTRLVSNMAYTI